MRPSVAEAKEDLIRDSMNRSSSYSMQSSKLEVSPEYTSKKLSLLVCEVQTEDRKNQEVDIERVACITRVACFTDTLVDQGSVAPHEIKESECKGHTCYLRASRPLIRSKQSKGCSITSE